MATRKLYITDYDKLRLKELIAVADEFGGHDRKDLESLARRTGAGGSGVAQRRAYGRGDHEFKGRSTRPEYS